MPKVIELMAGSVSLLTKNNPQAANVLIALDGAKEITFNTSASYAYKDELQSSQIPMRVGKVLFTDDTLWSQGMLHRRDVDNPNKWNVIEQSRERVEGFYKKQRSEKAPSGVSQPPTALINSVAYRKEAKSPLSGSQCFCRVYGGFNADVCEYCLSSLRIWDLTVVFGG
jgi:hypothetical protein